MPRRIGTRIAAVVGAVVLLSVLSTAAERDASDIPAPDEPGRPWLGVLLGDALDGGVEIVAVYAGGPAQTAGIAAGDLLVSLDGQAILRRQQVSDFMRDRAPGETVEMAFIRGGDARRANVRLQSRLGPVWAPRVEVAPRVIAPSSPWRELPGGRPSVESLLGATVVTMPDALRVHYDAPADAGVLVTRVADENENGLRVGDVLVAVNRIEVREPQDVLVSLLGVRGGEAAGLEVVRNREKKTVRYVVPSIEPAIPRVSWSKLERATEIERLEAEIRALESRLEGLKSALDRLKEGQGSER
jgi:S1-C subfamily serine protease